MLCDPQSISTKKTHRNIHKSLVSRFRPTENVVVLAIIIGLGGCNGEVRSRLLTPEQLQSEMSNPGGIKGVFGYYDKSVLEIDRLTQLTDANGKPVSGACNPITVQKIVTMTDQNHPVQIWYEAGLLEANQFSVQLNSSVFTAINSTSTPDQGKTLSNLASAATSFAKIAGAGAATAPTAPVRQPNCNAGPSFAGFQSLPPIP
jgi:hypothetical protein